MLFLKKINNFKDTVLQKLSLFFPCCKAWRGPAEPSGIPCSGCRVKFSWEEEGVRAMGSIDDWYQHRLGKRCEMLLERDCSKFPRAACVWDPGLTQCCYLERQRVGFYLREKDVMCTYWGAICTSQDNLIPNHSSLYAAVQQLHQDGTLHRRKQLLKCRDYQKTPQQTPRNTGRSLPAAESQREDQKSNIPGTNRVRSYQARPSSHPLRAPVGLEIPSCTAAPACLSSLCCRESKRAFSSLSLQGTDRRW